MTITKKDLEEIPDLRQVKEAIQFWEEALKKAEGKDKYIIKKAIIDLRKSQYLIKEASLILYYHNYYIPILSRISIYTIIKIIRKD